MGSRKWHFLPTTCPQGTGGKSAWTDPAASLRGRGSSWWHLRCWPSPSGMPRSSLTREQRRRSQAGRVHKHRRLVPWSPQGTACTLTRSCWEHGSRGSTPGRMILSHCTFQADKRRNDQHRRMAPSRAGKLYSWGLRPPRWRQRRNFGIARSVGEPYQPGMLCIAPLPAHHPPSCSRLGKQGRHSGSSWRTCLPCTSRSQPVLQRSPRCRSGTAHNEW